MSIPAAGTFFDYARRPRFPLHHRHSPQDRNPRPGSGTPYCNGITATAAAWRAIRRNQRRLSGDNLPPFRG
jgi:hypothetical protein